MYFTIFNFYSFWIVFIYDRIRSPIMRKWVFQETLERDRAFHDYVFVTHVWSCFRHYSVANFLPHFYASLEDEVVFKQPFNTIVYS